VAEQLHSTMLPVERMPLWVYSKPCTVSGEDRVKEEIDWPRDDRLCPFILKSGRLFCFNDLTQPSHPFSRITTGSWEKETAESWWTDQDKLGWYLELCGRSLNKLTGRKGLWLDKEHRRYYFPPLGDAQNPAPRTAHYKPLYQNTSNRSVAWQPLSKKTQQARPYWYHLAVALKFLQVARRSWVLSIRPELRVTKDGFTPVAAAKTGSYVTRKRSHAYNNDLLEDVQFWRWILSDGLPAILLHFGPGQQLVVSSTTLEQTITWPGMPEKSRLEFRNIHFEDDLFSLAEKQRLDEEYEDELNEGNDESDNDL